MRSFLLILIYITAFALTATSQEPSRHLTISYTIAVKSGNKNAMTAETYNGATKNVFISSDKARIQLVSLMRIQSILYYPGKTNQAAIILKESGRQKEKSVLNEKQWRSYNAAFEDASCQDQGASMTILDYPCKKILINLKSGKKVTAYYTDQLSNPIFQQAEPLFQCVPGIVLRYEFTGNKTQVIYTATRISRDPISESSFLID